LKQRCMGAKQRARFRLTPLPPSPSQDSSGEVGTANGEAALIIDGGTIRLNLSSGAIDPAAHAGLASLLPWAALAIFLRLGFKKLGQRLRHDAGWIQLGAAIGCCGVLVHSLVDFNLHIPANAAWFAVLAAVATIAPTGRRQFPEVNRLEDGP
jgi:hypothetical protein